MKFFTEVLYDTHVGILEFHFERVGYPSTTAYNVAVSVGPDETYQFSMQEKEEKWDIADASYLPDWIMSFEDELSDSICAHHKKALLL